MSKAQMFKVKYDYQLPDRTEYQLAVRRFCRTSIENEEAVLKEVLENFLGRKPTVDDYRKSQMVYQLNKYGITSYEKIEYTFCYNHQVLGTVTKEWSKNNIFTVSFNPVQPVLEKID